MIGIGLSVFAVSPFTPTQRFGMLMLTLLTTRLVGNLVLLPALLASPLGGCSAAASARRRPSEAARGEVGPTGTQVNSNPGAEPGPPHIRQNRGRISGAE